MIYTIENQFLKVQTDTFGGELSSIILKSKNKEYLYQADNGGRKSPILFPVCGNLKNGLTHNGINYPLTSHGFAAKMEFEIESLSQTSITYKLTDNEHTLKVYPFKFTLYVSYTLMSDSIICNFEVENNQDQPIFFSIGGHPAFKTDEFAYENYYVEFENIENVGIYKKDVLLDINPTPLLKNTKTLNLNIDLFANDALIFKDLTSKYVTLKNTQNDDEVRITFDNFPVFVIWSRSEKFVCLEPNDGCDDSHNSPTEFSEKEKIIMLDANNYYEKSYKIKIN